MRFRLRFRGRLLEVDATRATTTYTVLEGPPLQVRHHGDLTEVGDEATVPNP
jgi:alpha,alpha-trehalose phosphorylase